MESVLLTPESLTMTMPSIYPAIYEDVKPIHARSLKSNQIRLEWTQHSTCRAVIYTIITVITLVYNTASFANNYGKKEPVEYSNIYEQLFGEEALIYFVCVQWLLVFSIFLTGIVFERCIPQPIHLFLSVRRSELFFFFEIDLYANTIDDKH
ncbi:hypothetical protein DICVIV_14370 [Dictyocaulus viviparus]|uniref:Uncharacterized protein n=1 Tax=Dictyocaulus viviparus TaxID=29172 RepID=A0A0D8X7J0_DICVI|nr:hypothetical protein DICVIV_14370 [Dictyocaulus viviparus]